MRQFLLPLAAALLCTCAFGEETQFDQRRRQVAELTIQGDTEGALRLLENLGAAGDTDSDIVRGGLLSKLGRTSEALKILEPLAIAGNADAQWRMFNALLEASPPQPAKAQIWLRRAAQSGHVKAAIVLRQQNELPQFVNGRILVADMSAMIGRMMTEKAATYSDEALACYGTDREAFAGNFLKDMPSCIQALPEDMQVSFLPKDMDFFIKSIVLCINSAAYKRAGKTLSEMAACLPSR